MKNILILGSEGQIGKSLHSHLSMSGEYNVVGLDIEKSASHDLREKSDYIDSCFKEADFVYFLAFDVGGSKYLNKYQDTFGFLQNNMLLTTNVFEYCKKYNKPFIFASSQMSNMTYSNYGLLKAVGERYTKTLNGLTVKFWNVYGIETNEEKSHVITDFINSAKKLRLIKMLTDGSESRQFLHASDCCDALTLLMQKFNDLDKNREYHITSFQWNTIYEVADIIASKFPGTTIEKSESFDTVQNDTKNEPDDFIKSMWCPKVKLSEGIDNIIEGMSHES